MKNNEIITLRRKVVPESEFNLRRRLKSLRDVISPEPSVETLQHVRDKLRFKMEDPK